MQDVLLKECTQIGSVDARAEDMILKSITIESIGKKRKKNTRRSLLVKIFQK